MNINQWFILMEGFLKYKLLITNLNIEIKKNKSYTKWTKLIRNPNFPSELSENLVKLVWEKRLNKKIEWKIGSDLLIDKQQKHEVKCFVSGPSSFSPILTFKSIFFLDASYSHEGIFILYHINCNGEMFSKLNCTLSETFLDFQLKKKRPRCCFFFLLKQLREKKIEMSFYMITAKDKKLSIEQLFFPM